jgi:hypothetical protein
LDGIVNNVNHTLLEAIQCNMDITFIGSSASAKAVLYYITDYITKSQLKAHVAYRLEVASCKFGDFNLNKDEVTVHAKHLLCKCAYMMISHQELSTQQVCSYLMDSGDHYTSHEYRTFYWTSFEHYVDQVYPVVECENDAHCQTVEQEHHELVERVDEPFDEDVGDAKTYIDRPVSMRCGDAVASEDPFNDDAGEPESYADGPVSMRCGDAQALEEFLRNEEFSAVSLWSSRANAGP